MINRLLSRLVVSSQLRGPERLNIPDVSDWESLCSNSGLIVLIVFIIENQVLLVLRVKNPTLVSVLGTVVAGTGKDGGICLGGDVEDCECVFVVTVADVSAVELLVRSTVDEALCTETLLLSLTACEAAQRALTRGRIHPGPHIREM